MSEFTVFAVFVGTHVDLEVSQFWKELFQLWDDANADEKSDGQGQICDIAKGHWSFEQN